MERIHKFIVLCILLKDCVHTHQQNIPYGQPYPLGNEWIPYIPNTYDYSNGYVQHQYQEQQQLPNDFQSLQQMSTQYRYPQFQGIPTQFQNQPQITKSPKDIYTHPSFYFSGQHQEQAQYSDPQQYPSFQAQHQTNQVLHEDGGQYETSQYQYQDGTQQIQEQNIVNDYNHAPHYPVERFEYPIESHGQEMVVEPMYNTQNHESLQPVESILDEVPFSGSLPKSVMGLNSNQRQYPDGDLELQEQHKTSLQYSQQAEIQTEKSEIENLQQEIPETILVPTLKVIATYATFDINNQTYTSQCPAGLQGLLTIPGNCLKFLRCADRQIYQKVCAPNADDIVKPTKSPETLDNFCASKADGIYAHPYDCSKFVDCSPNGKFEKDCAPGTVFNVKILGCDHRYRVKCNALKTTDSTSTHSTDIYCPNGVFGHFPYPFSNEQFINCANSETLVEHCPPGTTFSLLKSYCDVPNYRHSTTWKVLGNSQKAATYRIVSCPESYNGSYLYPFDSTKYIICQDGRMQKMSCSSGDIYSVSKGICMAKSQTGVFDSVRSLQEMQPTDSIGLHLLYKQYNEIACPPEALGVFPYPFANTKYITCVDARLRIKRCRPRFLFSISRKLCDIPDHRHSFDTAVPVEIMGRKNDDVDIEAGEESNSLKCPSDASDNFVYPFLNTRYTKCLNGVTYIETCLSGAIYSIRQKKCLPKGQVDHNDYVEGIEMSLKTFSNDHTLGVYCGPENDGFLYAHPEDWKMFVICKNGIRMVKKCDGNKTFDMKEHKCL